MKSNFQPPVRSGLLVFFRQSLGSQFVIPVYQRNYRWTANKEVKQLVDFIIIGTIIESFYH